MFERKRGSYIKILIFFREKSISIKIKELDINFRPQSTLRHFDSKHLCTCTRPCFSCLFSCMPNYSWVICLQIPLSPSNNFYYLSFLSPFFKLISPVTYFVSSASGIYTFNFIPLQYFINYHI